MQLANCVVKLGGKHYHAVNRINVSVPEMQLLLQIHGEESIHPDSIVYAGERSKGFDEVTYLKETYGNKDEILKMIEQLFPGANPNLSTDFSQIGFPDAVTAEKIEAYEQAKAEAEQAEAERVRKLKNVRQKRAIAAAEAEDAAEEESELIKPPVSAKKAKAAVFA